MEEKKLYVYRYNKGFDPQHGDCFSLVYNYGDYEGCYVIKNPPYDHNSRNQYIIVVMTLDLKSYDLVFKPLTFNRPIVCLVKIGEIKVTWKRRSKNNNHKVHKAFGYTPNRRKELIPHYSESIIKELNEKGLL